MKNKLTQEILKQALNDYQTAFDYLTINNQQTPRELIKYLNNNFQSMGLCWYFKQMHKIDTYSSFDIIKLRSPEIMEYLGEKNDTPNTEIVENIIYSIFRRVQFLKTFIYEE